MVLTIYMKSGNKIKIRRVSSYEIKNQGSVIVGLTLRTKWWPIESGLLVKTIDLSQIEAVCVN